MFACTKRHLITVLVATMTAVTGGTAAAGNEGPPGSNAGPPYHFVTELMGGAGSVGVGLKDAGWLVTSKHGYRYQSGQQNSHLVVTRVNGGLRFADAGTKAFRKLSPACHRQNAKVGVAAVCRIPRSISVRSPLLVEIWPRLGNDYTNTSTLPATFAVTVLGDKGHDVARFGAGPDFFNGFSNRDVVWGGAGNDWIRAGIGNDSVHGGAGHDDIVAVAGRDAIFGGRGNDRVGGGPGPDRLRAGAGTDFVLCGTGSDNARGARVDRIMRDCESVH